MTEIHGKRTGTSHEADYFYRFQLSNDFYIFYIFFTRDFIFRLLGFGAIFRHSVFYDLERFSVIPSFRVWGDFPSFRHSTIPSFRVLGSPTWCRSIPTWRNGEENIRGKLPVYGHMFNSFCGPNSLLPYLTLHSRLYCSLKCMAVTVMNK